MKKLFCITITAFLFTVHVNAQTTYVLAPDQIDGKTMLAGYYNQGDLNHVSKFGFIVESMDTGLQIFTEEKSVSDKMGHVFQAIELAPGNYLVRMFTVVGNNAPVFDSRDKIEFLIQNQSFETTAQN